MRNPPQQKQTRREAIRLGLALGAGTLLDPARLLADQGDRPSRPGLVAIAKDDTLTPKSATVDAVLDLLDRGVEGLFGGPSRDVWSTLIRPDDVVGIKVNGLAGHGMSTRPVVVEAIVRRLREAGVPDTRIIIWDRLSRDLKSAGFPISVRGTEVQCFGNEKAGYENQLTLHRSVASLLARTLTRHCSVVINVPVLKDHNICGVTLAMKNFFGAIHNPNKYHLTAGDPYIADLYSHPAIRRKTVLTVADALSAQCNGGPPFMPRWSWNFGGLLLATDPVAMDTIGWRMIEKRRATHGLPTLAEARRPPTYIQTAQALGVGVASSERIEVIET